MGLNLSKTINSYSQTAPDGKEYVRVANVAPQAYDEVNDELKVKVSANKKIELIKKQLNYNNLIASATLYVGEDARVSSVQLLQPIDVTNYPKRTLIIYNYHDQPIKFTTPMFFIDNIQTQREIMPTDYTGGTVTDLIIPAFDTTYSIPGKLVIDGLSSLFLNKDLPYLGLKFTRSTIAPTTGYIDVYVFGSTV